MLDEKVRTKDSTLRIWYPSTAKTTLGELVLEQDDIVTQGNSWLGWFKGYSYWSKSGALPSGADSDILRWIFSSTKSGFGTQYFFVRCASGGKYDPEFFPVGPRVSSGATVPYLGVGRHTCDNYCENLCYSRCRYLWHHAPAIHSMCLSSWLMVNPDLFI